MKKIKACCKRILRSQRSLTLWWHILGRAFLASASTSFLIRVIRYLGRDNESGLPHPLRSRKGQPGVNFWREGCCRERATRKGGKAQGIKTSRVPFSYLVMSIMLLSAEAGSNPGGTPALQICCFRTRRNSIFHRLNMGFVCREQKKNHILGLSRSYSHIIKSMRWTEVKLFKACEGCERASGHDPLGEPVRSISMKHQHR